MHKPGHRVRLQRQRRAGTFAYVTSGTPIATYIVPAIMPGVKERIQKILANAGVGSRRGVEEMVQQGRIAVNGKITKTLPILINPEKDTIEVDGEPLKIKPKQTGPRLYLLMNKPKGVYS